MIKKTVTMIASAVVAVAIAGGAQGHPQGQHGMMGQGSQGWSGPWTQCWAGQGAGQGSGTPGCPLANGMGPGMMGQGGMGQGMMGQGQMGSGMMGQGPMGPGMMGPGGGGRQGWGMMAPLPEDLSVDSARHMLEHYVAWQGNPRLKLGKVEEEDADTIVGEIVTQDDSLVQRVEIDRHTGMMRPAS